MSFRTARAATAGADEDKIDARFENGVLVINIGIMSEK